MVPRGLPEVEQAEDALVRQGAQPLNLMALLSEEGDAIFAGVEPAGRGAVLARVCLLLAGLLLLARERFKLSKNC